MSFLCQLVDYQNCSHYLSWLVIVILPSPGDNSRNPFLSQNTHMRIIWKCTTIILKAFLLTCNPNWWKTKVRNDIIMISNSKFNHEIHMSQWMTFLYSPQLGNRSSRPVTKPTAMISKAWQPCGTSNLDRTIAPLRMRVDKVSYPCTCVVGPSEMTLYREAYWPLAVSQS